MQVIIANHECTICWDGVYYFALSDYPNISHWELKKLLAFLDYEKQHGRETEIVCENKGILTAVNNAITHPETVESATLPEKITECTACVQKGCLTQYVCHTATIENAMKIFTSGKLLSAVNAFCKTGDELVHDKRNAASDPADYFDYVMFAWGNCQAGDRLVMERLRDGNPNENDYGVNFAPGVRYYFRYKDITRHPGYVFDGYHPAKIKDEIILSEYLYACIIPGQNKSVLGSLVQRDITDRTHYIKQDGLGLWDWTTKVYAFIEGLDKT